MVTVKNTINEYFIEEQTLYFEILCVLIISFNLMRYYCYLVFKKTGLKKLRDLL